MDTKAGRGVVDVGVGDVLGERSPGDLIDRAVDGIGGDRGGIGGGVPGESDDGIVRRH
jgi:hypothetical protein